MDTSGILFTLLVLLTATAVCVALFQRLGFGSVVGFIIAGVIVGPHTPGPQIVSDLSAIENVAQLGVVLFLFSVGMEMRPRQFWAMRKQLLGVGLGQVLISALCLGGFLFLVLGVHWRSAVIVGLGLAQSSTAIVMAILASRGDLSSAHGRNIFSILMAQDLSVVPAMALVPILAHHADHGAGPNLWFKALLAAGVLAGIFLLGRYALPAGLGWAARTRNNDAFGIILFVGVVAASWAVDQAGISMTLGAFLLGMLLSASDYRYQVAALIAPFQGTLMGLFFIAVGMQIDLSAMVADWPRLLALVVAVLAIKILVIVALCRLFRVDGQTSVRSGFYLCQVGEFAFVLFAASHAAGLLSKTGAALGFLTISIGMILTPLMVKLGDRLARGLRHGGALPQGQFADEMHNHLVLVGAGEVGFVISLMAEKAGIPYVAFDNNFDAVQRARRAGFKVFLGDIRSAAVRGAAGLGRARAVFVSPTDASQVRALALSLKEQYPNLGIFGRVDTVAEQEYLRSRGIAHVGTVYIESTLFRGEELLKEMGVTDDAAQTVVAELRKDDYQLVKARVDPSYREAAPA